MRILLLSFLAATTAGLAPAADTASLAGKWQLHTSIAGNDFDMVCTFTQKDDALGGSCASEQGTYEITGSVNGNKVTWSYKSEYNGTPLTVKYEGAVGASNKIIGSVNVPEFSAGGDFTATQQK
jgi:hypothetical protein